MAGSVRCSLLVVAIVVSTFEAALAGDFGRPDPSIFEGLLPPQLWYGPVTGQSLYPFTNDEEELRDRSYVLIRPNEPRSRWNILLAQFRFAHVLPPGIEDYDVTAYGQSVLWTPRRSEASQYNRVIDDMKNDAQTSGRS